LQFLNLKKKIKEEIQEEQIKFNKLMGEMEKEKEEEQVKFNNKKEELISKKKNLQEECDFKLVVSKQKLAKEGFAHITMITFLNGQLTQFIGQITAEKEEMLKVVEQAKTEEVKNKVILDFQNQLKNFNKAKVQLEEDIRAENYFYSLFCKTAKEDQETESRLLIEKIRPLDEQIEKLEPDFYLFINLGVEKVKKKTVEFMASKIRLESQLYEGVLVYNKDIANIEQDKKKKELDFNIFQEKGVKDSKYYEAI